MLRSLRASAPRNGTATLAILGCISASLAGCTSGRSARTTHSDARVTPYVHPTPQACPSHTDAPITKVRLTALEGKPDVAVKLRSSFEVEIHGQPRVSTPLVTPADAVCLVELSPSAAIRTAIYYVLKPERITVAATITGVAGGIGHPLFNGTFVAR